MADPMDACALLIKDHKKVARLLDEMLQTTPKSIKTRENLLEQLAEELSVHEEIEEKIFYPAVKTKKTEDIILEAYEEHHVVDQILAELQNTPVDDETWGAKLKVLSENITHHVEEEEEGLFPKVKKIMNKNELIALGEQMQEMKEKEPS